MSVIRVHQSQDFLQGPTVSENRLLADTFVAPSSRTDKQNSRPALQPHLLLPMLELDGKKMTTTGQPHRFHPE